MSNICELIPRIHAEDLQMALNSIRARLLPYSFLEKLKMLEKTAVHDDYEKIFLRFVVAEFFLAEKKIEASLVFLKGLVEEAEALGLKNLIPDFYLLILNQYYLQLKQSGNVELSSKIYERISTISPVNAYLLNYEGEVYA